MAVESTKVCEMALAMTEKRGLHAQELNNAHLDQCLHQVQVEDDDLLSGTKRALSG